MSRVKEALVPEDYEITDAVQPAAGEGGLREALEASRANCKDVMTALLVRGGRENILLADRVHKADDLARAALSNSVPAGVVGKAATDVMAERERQKAVEGWTPEHDDTHGEGELAAAAGVYALAAASQDDYRWVLRGMPTNDYLDGALRLWPWHPTWFKPTSRRRDLVKAGALILAEIERLDRITPPAQEPTR